MGDTLRPQPSVLADPPEAVGHGRKPARPESALRSHPRHPQGPAPPSPGQSCPRLTHLSRERWKRRRSPGAWAAGVHGGAEPRPRQAPALPRCADRVHSAPGKPGLGAGILRPSGGLCVPGPCGWQSPPPGPSGASAVPACITRSRVSWPDFQAEKKIFCFHLIIY